jgi:hypothetical protein
MQGCIAGLHYFCLLAVTPHLGRHRKHPRSMRSLDDSGSNPASTIVTGGWTSMPCQHGVVHKGTDGSLLRY